VSEKNLKQALQQVKANKGSAGVDGMTVGGITDYLKQHWPANPRTTAEWDLRAETGEAGGNPQAGRRGAKAWYPDGAGSFDPAGGDAGSAAAVGLDVLDRTATVFDRDDPRIKQGPGTAIHCRGLRLGELISIWRNFSIESNHPNKLMSQIAKRVEDKRAVETHPGILECLG